MDKQETSGTVEEREGHKKRFWEETIIAASKAEVVKNH